MVSYKYNPSLKATPHWRQQKQCYQNGGIGIISSCALIDGVIELRPVAELSHFDRSIERYDTVTGF